MMKRLFETGSKNHFLVWGNITDFIKGERYASLRQYLLDWLVPAMDIVIIYDISAGLQFPEKGHEELFREATGFVKPEPDVGKHNTRDMSEKEIAQLKQAVAKLENMPEPEFPKKPDLCLQLIEGLMNGSFQNGNTEKQHKRHRVALIVEYAETIAPRDGGGHLDQSDRVNTVTLRRLAENAEIRGECVVILIARSMEDMHASIHGRGSLLAAIEIPYPDKDSRRDFIGGHPAITKKLAMNIGELVNATAGLSLREIEDIHKSVDGKPLALSAISASKQKVFKDHLGDIMEVMDPRWGFEGIGGMSHLKSYFMELKKGLFLGDPNLVPPAIILMGPPGTGKTALAEAIAGEWNVPFVEFKNIRSMWQGESERNMERAIQMVESLTPCVLFWDEFDQEEAPRGSYVGDNGVSNRLRKMRFKLTSNPKNLGKFLVIYATNMPELLDAADKRSGRAQCIPMLLPGDGEQEDIFRVMPALYDFMTDVDSFTPIVKILGDTHGEYISGADIREISLSAYRIMRLRNGTKVEKKDYTDAIADFVPHHYAGTEIREMEEYAVRERSRESFLSLRGKEIARRLQVQRGETR